MESFTGTRRYSVVRQIGQGGMGSVYEALDTLLGTTVAIKTLDRDDSPELLYFKREFRTIAELRHPNLVRLFDLKRDDARWFFTMELVDGVPMTEYVAHHRRIVDGASGEILDMEHTAPTHAVGTPDPIAPEDRREAIAEPACDMGLLADLTGQVLDALEALHGAGVVHRDLKPDNVLVTRAGQVKLVDFGIVQGPEADQWQDRVMGTASYMSPEQAQGYEVTAASDMYSLGVMLFRLIAGRKPFGGNSVEILASHRYAEIPDLADWVEGVPEPWRRACAALLAKDAADRPGLVELRGMLGLRRRTAPSAAPPTEEIFVGRERERRRLREAMAEAHRRRLRAVLIQGESGAGKTALLDACAGEARLDGFAVFRGRCYEREDVPYPAFDRLVDRVALALSEWEEGELEVWRDALEEAARLFPMFRVPLQRINPRWGMGALEVDGDPVVLRRRGARALSALVAALCARSPVLFILDDLQWCAPEDAQMLDALVETCQRCPLTIVGAYREGALSDDHPLVSVLEGAALDARFWEMSVGPLSRSEIAALLAQKVSYDLPARAAEYVHQQTQGNPFFASQMALMLALHGPQPWEGAALPSLLDLVRWRLDGLDMDARHLVELVAVAGGTVDRKLLAAASALPAARFEVSLDQIRRSGLLRATAPTATDDALASGAVRFDLVHDRFREVAYRDLKPHTRLQRHGALALALESALPHAEPASPWLLEALYRHWAGAEQWTRAHRFGLEAAEAAAGCLAFERAASLYTEILTGPARTFPDSSEDTLLRVQHWARLADMLEHGGDYTAAVSALSQALETLSEPNGDPPLVALPDTDNSKRASAVRTLYLRLADDLVKTGQVAAGEQAFERLLAPMGLKLVRGSLDAQSTLAALRLRAAGRAVVGSRRAPTAMDRFALDLFRRIFESFALVKPLYIAEYQMRHQAIADRIDDPAARAYALAFEGMLTTMSPRLTLEERATRGRALFKDAQIWFAKTDQLFGPVYAQGPIGFLHWLEGDWDTARQIFEDALDYAESRGAERLWEAFMARAWLVRALHYMGDHDATQTLADTLFEEAGTGDVVRFGQAALVTGLRLIQQGRLVEVADLVRQWRPRVPEGPNYQRVMLGAVENRLELARGRIDGLPERILTEGQALHEAGCLFSSWHRALWHLPGLEAAAGLEALGVLDRRTRAALQKIAKDLTRDTPPFMACLVHRSGALLAHAERDFDTAHARIARALTLSHAARAPHHHFLCLEAASRIGAATEADCEEMADLALRNGYCVW